MALPDSAIEYYLSQQKVSATTLAVVKRLWLRMGNDFDASWVKMAPALIAAVERAQNASVDLAADFVPQVLAEQGLPDEPLAELDRSSLTGMTGGGGQLDTALYSSVIKAKTAVAEGASPLAALQQGSQWLQMLVQTTLSDTGRAAESVGIATRKNIGYVRMLNPPSCSRCSILAGRWYRWSSGFARHPRCDCRMVATTEKIANDITTDPRRYFDSLSPREQDKIFTISGANAIREGADMGQVVNSRKGMQRAQVYGQKVSITSEGTTRRGIAGKIIRSNGGNPNARLMPDSIYQIAASREEAVALLRSNGYLLPTSVKVVEKVKPVIKVEPIDLDKVQREAAAVIAKNRANIESYLAAELKYKADVTSYLAAEKKYLDDQTQSYLTAEKTYLDSQTKAYLAAEKKFLAAEKRRLAAEKKKLSSAGITSVATRDLAEAARKSLPVRSYDEQSRIAWSSPVRNGREFPVDKNGRKLVPAETMGHLDTVLAMGKSLRADIDKKALTDKALVKLRKELAKAGQWGGSEIKRNIARREREMILEAIGEVRPLGGVKQPAHLVTVATQKDVGGDFALMAGKQADLDLLREAEQVFPADWLRVAGARGSLNLGRNSRAYFSEASTRPGMDSLAAPAKDDNAFYNGTFSAYPAEVMAHELGHRMESTIPGLTHLEFALVRRRATHNGVLETPKEMFGAGSGEFSYEDNWRRAYAGKTYGENTNNPMDIFSEVFQVGLQDALGRSQIKGEYAKSDEGDFELQEFVMGVLALL